MEEKLEESKNKESMNQRRTGRERSGGGNNNDRVQAIYYYFRSVRLGDQYLWQTLPRALELLFELIESNIDKSLGLVKMLDSIETYKIAHALDVLFSHANNKNALNLVVNNQVGRVAIEYPSQLYWWMFHFKHFDPEKKSDEGASSFMRMAGNSSKNFKKSFFDDVNKQILENPGFSRNFII